MTLEEDGVKVSLSVNFYRFQLSRLKGSFVGYGYSNSGGTADEDAFWTIQDKFDGSDTLQTWDAYYRAKVLETCKIYLIGLWVFEKNNLTLADTTVTNIETELEEILNDFGSGSKTKLNAVLQPYGVNYKMLKTVFETEAKLETAEIFLYGENASKIGTETKDAFLGEHYLRFKQIFYANYAYEYLRDTNGDIIYYDEDGAVLYDTVNGYARTENGTTVYYLTPESKQIAYDTVNGSPKYKTDSSGNVVRRTLTEEEAANVLSDAQTAYEQIKDSTEAEFENLLAAENGTSEYTDGYYLLRGTDYTSVSDDLGYLTEIEQKLDLMKVGEVAWLVSDSGYHIIRRYEPTSGAYDMEVNEVWFTSFADNLMGELFLEECEKHLANIGVKENVLASAPSLAEIEPNYSF